MLEELDQLLGGGNDDLANDGEAMAPAAHEPGWVALVSPQYYDLGYGGKYYCPDPSWICPRTMNASAAAVAPLGKARVSVAVRSWRGWEWRVKAHPSNLLGWVNRFGRQWIRSTQPDLEGQQPRLPTVCVCVCVCVAGGKVV
jgi:hypothetical protein